MAAGASLEQALTKALRRARLSSPARIQAFLDACAYSTDPIYRSPLSVLRERVAHCFDGALFAAAALRRLGQRPLILDLLPNGRDDDHLLALFQVRRHWGALAKSNFVGLRFREPIHRNLRELVLSYFESYYNVAGEKTLRAYTVPLNLERFDPLGWTVRDEPLEQIATKLDRIRRIPLITPAMAAALSPVDQRTLQAGLLGADEKGLYRPPAGGS